MPVPPVSLFPVIAKTVAGVKAIVAAPAAIGVSAIGSSLTLVSAASLLGGIAVAGLGIYGLIKARERAKASTRARARAISNISDYRPPSTQEIVPAGEPPFYGGQSVGIRYVIELIRSEPEINYTSVYAAYYSPLGAISSLAMRNLCTGEIASSFSFEDNHSFGVQIIVSDADVQDYETATPFGQRCYNLAGGANYSLRVRRADYQPDTGGDPPGTPAVVTGKTAPANTTFPYIPPERFTEANSKDYGLLFEPKKTSPYL